MVIYYRIILRAVIMVSVIKPSYAISLIEVLCLDTYFRVSAGKSARGSGLIYVKLAVIIVGSDKHASYRAWHYPVLIRFHFDFLTLTLFGQSEPLQIRICECLFANIGYIICECNIFSFGSIESI